MSDVCIIIVIIIIIITSLQCDTFSHQVLYTLSLLHINCKNAVLSKL